MRKTLLLSPLLLAAPLLAQPRFLPSDGSPAHMLTGSVPPSGACSDPSQLWYVWPTQHLWGCNYSPASGIGAWVDQTTASLWSVSAMAKLPIWRAKLATVATAAGDARVLLVGDSTTWGAFGANYPGNTTSTGWPALMSKLLPALTPASNATATGQITITDSRVALTGTFATTNVGAGFGHACFTVTGSGTLVFTPGDGVTYDSFAVYTQGGQGGGTISATATGGSASNIVQPYSNTVVKTTVTAASLATTNAVTLSWVSGTSVQVVGIEAFASSVSRVRLANVGVSGSASGAWADTNTSIAAIKGWSPDLTVIMLGINDAQSNTPVATYTANLQTIINAAKLSGGDVVLMSMVPSDPSLTSATANEAAYVPALTALAATNGLPFLDLYNRFGGAFQSPLMTNTLHPNSLGYADMARFVYSQLFF